MRWLHRWAGLALGSAAVAAACSQGGSPGIPPVRIEVTAIPSILPESTPEPFTFLTVDSSGSPRPFLLPLSISALGPLRPGSVLDSNGILVAAMAFDLGGSNQITVTGTGLTPAVQSIYVAPQVPTRVTGAGLGGSVLGPGSGWDKDGVWAPSAVATAGVIRLYYAATSGGSLAANIGLAISSDGGNTFSRSGAAPLVGPKAAASACHASGADHPSVYFDGAQWVMLYEGDNGSVSQLCRATSPDGLSWTPIAGPLGPNGAVLTVTTGSLVGFDISAIRGMAVAQEPNGSWIGAYVGEGSDPALGYQLAGLGLATSTDGIHWTKMPGSRRYQSLEVGAMEYMDNTEWDTYQVIGPALERIGSVYRLWATGLGTPGTSKTYRIGRYASLNPAAFGPHIENYLDPATAVIGLGPSGAFDDAGTMLPSVVVPPDGIKRVYYTGIHAADGLRRIGLARF